MKSVFNNVIICFGDSITQGMRMPKGKSYPEILGEHLKGQFNVLNAGVGGETSYTICSRANALPFTVTKDIVFEKGELEFVSDYKIFSGINGEEIKYRYGWMGHDLPITSIIIDGKHYTMRFDCKNNEEKDNYVLCRTDASQKQVIKVGARVNFDYSGVYKNCYCTVLLQGANDVLPTETIIERYKRIQALNERFIALIPHYRDDESHLFYEAFPDRCVNLREYCKEKVWKEYNLDINDSDKKQISDGYLPSRFTLTDNVRDCHLNELGYRILADLVYKKGKELKYWK